MKKLIIIPLLFISLIISATNYYVKTGGSDAADGSDDANAWETIAKVYTYSNTTGFLGDDTIFLNKGDTWNERLNIKSSGTESHPIVISAYGTGDLPMMTQQIKYATWVNLSGNIYYTVNAYYSAYGCLFTGNVWGIRKDISTLSDLDTQNEWITGIHGAGGGTDDTIYVYTSAPDELPDVIFGLASIILLYKSSAIRKQAPSKSFISVI